NPMKPVTIIGGGLAGLTLGIGLRQQEVPVVIHEAGGYPRHRVCGEVISGRGQETLVRPGLHRWVEQTGAITASTAAFFSEPLSTPARPLPATALCLSRHALDTMLANKFAESGGILHSNDRWRGEFTGGVVRATGRRLQTEEGGNRWLGLKIH